LVCVLHDFILTLDRSHQQACEDYSKELNECNSKSHTTNKNHVVLDEVNEFVLTSTIVQFPGAHLPHMTTLHTLAFCTERIRRIFRVRVVVGCTRASATLKLLLGPVQENRFSVLVVRVYLLGDEIRSDFVYLSPVGNSKGTSNDLENEDECKENSEGCHHAVVLFHRTTTAEESDDEDNHSHHDDQHGGVGKLRGEVLEFVAVFVTDDGSNDDEDQTTQPKQKVEKEHQILDAIHFSLNHF